MCGRLAGACVRMQVQYGLSLLLVARRSSSGTLVLPSPEKKQFSKFQFNPEWLTDEELLCRGATTQPW